MKRVQLQDGFELRVARRRGSSARGAESIVISLFDMSRAIGTIAVPMALVEAFCAAIGELRLADLVSPSVPTGRMNHAAPPEGQTQ